MDALLRNAIFGKKIRLITNSYETNDVVFLNDAARAAAMELMSKTKNIRYFERKKTPRNTTAHGKITQTPGTASIGSSNADGQSLKKNGELIVTIFSKKAADKLKSYMNEDCDNEHATEYTLEDLKKLPITTQSVQTFWLWMRDVI